MERSSTANELPRVEQQHARGAQPASQDVELLKRFAVLLGLIALALTVAALFANLPDPGAIRSQAVNLRAPRVRVGALAVLPRLRRPEDWFQGSDRASSVDRGPSLGCALKLSKPAAQAIPALCSEQWRDWLGSCTRDSVDQSV
jgi:hypothetical protein